MDWLFGTLRYLGNVIVPTRFRSPSPEYHMRSYANRSASRWERPEDWVKDDGGDGGEAVEETGAGDASPEAEEAEKPSTFWSRAGTVLRWILHILLVLLVLVGMYFLNWLLDLPKILQSNWPFLHAFWLPILFFLFYIIIWLGLWLWQLSSPDRHSWDYPDITAAWEVARNTLERAGIDLKQTPIFLVLGQNEGTLEHLFGSAVLRLRITAPRGGGVSVKLYAANDRIYITCPGTSVLARQARFLMEQGTTERQLAEEVQLEQLLDQPVVSNNQAVSGEAQKEPAESGDADEQVKPSNGAQGQTEETEPKNNDAKKQQTETVANASISAGMDSTGEEEQRVMELLASDSQTNAKGRGAKSFLKNPVELRLLTSRMHHLCRLIRNDRKPYCPINGILVLVPFSAICDDADASQTATACRYDLTVVRKVLQVRCPVFALVCDMEDSQGFCRFVRQLPNRERIPRLGQQFPLYPDIDANDIPHMVETGTAWLSDALLPSLVYNLFRIESMDSGQRGPAITLHDSLENNSSLFDFVHDFRDGRKRLGRLLSRGLMLDVSGSYYFGGVYLAGTGRNMTVFISGVMQKLIENQNYVAWTKDTLTAERRYRNWSWLLFLVNVILLVGGPILAWLFWPL